MELKGLDALQELTLYASRQPCRGQLFNGVGIDVVIGYPSEATSYFSLWHLHPCPRASYRNNMIGIFMDAINVVQDPVEA
jgi:hypothetical protein